MQKNYFLIQYCSFCSLIFALNSKFFMCSLNLTISEMIANIDIDGMFGAGTLSAIFNIQEKNDLKVDGVVGDSTWAVIDDMM